MNLALALVSRESGGAEFQAGLLADGLRARGHRVTFYCTQPAASEAMLEHWQPFPARIVRPLTLPAPILQSVWAIAQFRAWLARDKIDAAIGILGMPHAVLSYAALGTRVKVYGRRSCVWAECRGYGTYDKHIPMLQRWVRRWGWRTTALVCNTEAVRTSARAVEGWPADKLRVIPNGWPEYEASDCRAVTPYYVARLRPEKAVDVACHRFAHAGVPLALAADVPDWRQVGILAHCSRADALSNSVGMAMAHGIPVVAFDLPGNLELLGEDACVPQWHYLNMSEAVRRLRRDIRTRLKIGEELQARVRTHFSLKAMVDAWESLLTNGGE